MKFKDIIGKRIAVHCDTKEKANKFLQECENMKWLRNGSWYSEYRNGICYTIKDDGKSHGVFCSNVGFYTNEHYTIIEFDDIVFED